MSNMRVPKNEAESDFHSDEHVITLVVGVVGAYWLVVYVGFCILLFVFYPRFKIYLFIYVLYIALIMLVLLSPMFCFPF